LQVFVDGQTDGVLSDLLPRTMFLVSEQDIYLFNSSQNHEVIFLQNSKVGEAKHVTYCTLL